MRRIVFAFLTSALLSTASAQQPPSPAAVTNQPTDGTNPPTLGPTTRAPTTIVPTLFPKDAQPVLPPDAARHQYLGYRLGMAVEEAALVAQTAGKKLEEVEKDRKYLMNGCLVEVPNPDKAGNLLLFKNGKLELLMVFWDDNTSRLYNNLLDMVTKKYGKPEKADELFRRFWILENGDCIRLLYEVAAHQTSLLYGSQKAVFDFNDEEKRDIIKNRDYPGFP
jgi:hypothetical protein